MIMVLLCPRAILLQNVPLGDVCCSQQALRCACSHWCAGANMLYLAVSWRRWLSLLNCFSGGVFLAAGLVHLLPHCQESQERLGALVGDYPLYLVLITLGYMLVLFVERVLFDVHGSAHGHGPHTGGWVYLGSGSSSLSCAAAHMLLHNSDAVASTCIQQAVTPGASTVHTICWAPQCCAYCCPAVRVHCLAQVLHLPASTATLLRA